MKTADPKVRLIKGVRYKRVRGRRGAWHNIQGTEPRVHLARYDKLNKLWVTSCKPGVGPLGGLDLGLEVEDWETPVTCKLCLGRGVPRERS